MGNHPITSAAWSYYEIHAPIAADARDIELGVRLEGQGSAWADNVSISFDDLLTLSANLPQDPIGKVVQTFADARNAHDGKAAADTYSPDGEYIGTGSLVRGTTALASLWGSVQGEAKRTITSVDVSSPRVATAHVMAEFTDGARLQETFVLVRESTEWKIRLHTAIQQGQVAR